MKVRFNALIVLCCMITGSSLNSACTKTETQPHEKESMARISSFKIVNTTNEILGAINNEDHTITVTLPAGLYMTSLEPEVKVAPGATLKQGADSLITNMVDYFSHGRQIQYPVTATDGSSSMYTLIIKSEQPAMTAKEISTDSSNPVTYDQSFWYTRNEIYVYNTLRNYPYIGSYESDLELLKASLVDKNGKEYPFKVGVSNILPYTAQAYVTLTLNDIEGRMTNNGTTYNKVPVAGDYYVKVRYYSQEVILKNPIRIFYNN